MPTIVRITRQVIAGLHARFDRSASCHDLVIVYHRIDIYVKYLVSTNHTELDLLQRNVEELGKCHVIDDGLVINLQAGRILLGRLPIDQDRLYLAGFRVVGTVEVNTTTPRKPAVFEMKRRLDHERRRLTEPFGLGVGGDFLEVAPHLEWHLGLAPLDFSLVGREPIADLAAPDPVWNGIHCFDPTKQTSIGATLSLISALRSEKFSASLSFFPSNKWQYNLLPLLAGIPRRIGFRYHLKRTSSLSWLNSATVPVDPRLHDVDQNLRLSGRLLELTPEKLPLQFPALAPVFIF